jgi:GDSL-like Lipase/Acylhydrolase family/GLTT repeat (6 copies)
MMTTFAALGDSITLGVGDPVPGGGWRGWAALLADSLPRGRLVNLAANGARVADVERTQLPRALELRPVTAQRRPGLQVGVPEPGVPELGVPELGVPELGVPELGVPEIGVPEPGVPELGVRELGAPELGVPELGYAP